MHTPSFAAAVLAFAAAAAVAQNTVSSESKRPATTTPSTVTTESAGRQPGSAQGNVAPPAGSSGTATGGGAGQSAGNTPGVTTHSGTVAPTTGTVGTGNAMTANSGDRQASGRDRKAEDAWARAHRASKIIGTEVRNRQGQKLGEIKDVVLGSNGTVAYAVVNTGGFLGMRNRMHAIPWTAMQTNTGDRHFLLDMDKERLTRAPGFDDKQWPNMADERWNSETRGFYANPPGTGAQPPANR